MSRRCMNLLLGFLPAGDVEELDGTEKNTLKIFKSITLVHEVGMVMLEVSSTKDVRIRLGQPFCVFCGSRCCCYRSF